MSTAATTDLADELRDRRIDVVTLPTALFAVLDPAGLPDLRVVAAAGETCTVALARAWAPGRTLFNVYGPSECTLCTTLHRVDPAAETVPLGAPIANSRAYVLDRRLQPVPDGVLGELYIGGIGPARGYAGRSDLTAERFVPDPFGEPGSRMYRSGDCMRWNRSGELEFAGRVDDQLKIRGFRVEPGEVEAGLLRHPAVSGAVATAWRDERGHQRLVAYVTGEGDGTELREFLRRSLPDHLVPSAVLVLPKFPLGPSGKVDRRRLPSPESALAEDEYVPPAGPAEETMAAVWAEVLRVDRVGRSGNFFHLGGDSILSLQLVTAARRAGLRFDAKDLFLHQTLAELTAVAVPAGSTDGPATAPDEPVTGEVPLTPVQHWFFEQHTARPHHFHQSVLAELAPDVDEQQLRASLARLVERHDALRLRFVRSGDGWRQELVEVALDADLLDVRDLAALPSGDRAAERDRTAREVQRGFRLGRAPLLRAVLFRAGPEEPPLLFLTAHHLVVDSVSWRVLLADLESPSTEPAGTSFAGWARRLREHTLAGGFDGDLGYWSAPVDGKPLPTDGAPDGGGVRQVDVELSTEQTTALLRAAPAVFRTRANEVLIAALAWTLSDWIGHDRVLLDLEAHGRGDLVAGVDLSGSAGWFTNAFPVELVMPAGAEADWRAVVRAVRSQLRAVPSDGLGYGALRYLAKALSADRPAAQVVFNYHGESGGRSAPGGLVRGFAEPIGEDQDPTDEPSHLIEVVGAVVGGRLRFTWYYSVAALSATTVRDVADTFTGALRRIAELGTAPR